jgi:hypothetical protein
MAGRCSSVTAIEAVRGRPSDTETSPEGHTARQRLDDPAANFFARPRDHGQHVATRLRPDGLAGGDVHLAAFGDKGPRLRRRQGEAARPRPWVASCWPWEQRRPPSPCTRTDGRERGVVAAQYVRTTRATTCTIASGRRARQREPHAPATPDDRPAEQVDSRSCARTLTRRVLPVQ